ncbi:DEKNAAC103511 [Brettanomyces naardenensis]|uniref:DEKNAAC103511 n=1 Tax=Brettanomyces naardenensis TaxID=13370 RepID=A0A448YNU5_BRENA|nr:DEKNAAC103511 [Brettanomyces naardenensis]
MWKLVQSGLSVVAGTAEPEYGPDSIRPVGYDLEEGEKCYSDLSREDMFFRDPGHTNVETQVFYFEDEVHSGFAQIIHSDMVGLHTTAQFTFKVFSKEEPDKFVWTSTKLEDFSIQNGADFIAKDLSIVLNEEGDTYTLNSKVTPKSEVIDLKLVKIGQGIKFGKDATTYYGTDVENPWGSMRHIFWPRCKANGQIICRYYREPEEDEQNEEGDYLEDNLTDPSLQIKEETIDIKDGLGMYVMALQGMKPHHAAATWDFLNYQSEDHSVVIMEYTTPPSYNRTTVSTAMIVDNEGKVVLATLHNKTEHLDTYKDEECGWLVPRKMKYTMTGVNDDNKETVAVVSADLKKMSERVDVLSEIPQFVKSIVSGVAGTRPYIYQFSNTMNLVVNVDGKEIINESGYGYSESTFISGEAA